MLKTTLYDPAVKKVVFILHSQGGIEGGMILDWLLQEVPADLLSKLEIYTFGNAANHFNNPYKDVGAQASARRGGDSDGRLKKAVRYIEHYAHTDDFVARWGVLNFLCNFSFAVSGSRYVGRVFEYPAAGHQFVQHYLDGMFPLEACAVSEEFPLGWKGAAGEQGSVFMTSRVQRGRDGDELGKENAELREGWESSVRGANGGDRTVVRDEDSPIGKREGLNGLFEDVLAEEERRVRGYRVSDLSRLWCYTNGKSPRLDEVDRGIARMSTI